MKYLANEKYTLAFNEEIPEEPGLSLGLIEDLSFGLDSIGVSFGALHITTTRSVAQQVWMQAHATTPYIALATVWWWCCNVEFHTPGHFYVLPSVRGRLVLLNSNYVELVASHLPLTAFAYNVRPRQRDITQPSCPLCAPVIATARPIWEPSNDGTKLVPEWRIYR